jgi:hypothetical protein
MSYNNVALLPALPPAPTSISNRFLDFWLLGGASILFFFVMAIGSIFRNDSTIVQQKFFLLGPFFGLLSIICNNPHFLISYRLGYSRGMKFILKYWISLIVVPIGIIFLYIIAYLNFDLYVGDNYLIQSLNRIFAASGIGYRFGETANLGKELISLSIWMMYLTVGWHYFKQIYGCLMVFSRFDQYTLSSLQKRTIKYSLLALAVYQFLFSSELMDQAANTGYQDQRFPGISMIPLALPHWILQLSEVAAGSLFLIVIVMLIRKYLKEKKAPSWIFIVTWLSIYFWWVQVLNLPEYYYLAVPFFHSLQYLPFAYKMERSKISSDRWTATMISLRVVGIFILGFLVFELIPSNLDRMLETDVAQTTWFFVTAVAVFVNIHHFFIDSVVWRLQQHSVDKVLFK